MRKTIFIICLIIALVVIGGCSSVNYKQEEVEKLANCLVEKEVVEYGAFWCPNCAKQEKMFGSSFGIIKNAAYVECDPRCAVEDIKDLPMACRGIFGQTEICLEKKVEKYPTWDFQNGNRLVGVQDFKTLAGEAGCEFNE